MKRAAQALLRQVGLYQRVKSSRAYDLYWRVANPKLIEERDREVAFFRDLLTGFHPGDLVFDIGANMGQKADVFLRLGARVIAVDPDRTNQRILRERFLEWRWRPKPLTIVGKAVSASDGSQTFFVDTPGSAKNTLNSKWVEALRNDSARFGEVLQFRNEIEVETVRLDTMILTFGQPAFIKIDVEGHEAAVLSGLSRPVPCISFEVNLPEFQPEACRCVELLDSLDLDGCFNFAADCRIGFASPRWLSKTEVLEAIDVCNEPCIEVFWKSSVTGAAI